MAIKFLNSQSIDGELTVTGDVGIGTTTPTSKLYVDGGALGGTAGDDVALLNLKTTTTNYDTLQFTSERLSTGTTWTSAAHRIQRKVDTTLMGYIQFGSKDDDLITFGENATEYMRIDANGKVGIGTTSPGSYNSSFNNLVIEGAGSAGLTISTGNTSRGQIAFADGTSGDQAYRGLLRYDHADNYFAILTEGLQERMRIASGGNVGIGTTSPNSELHIASLSPVLTLQDTNSPLPNQVGIEFTDSTNNVHAEIRMDSGTSGSLSIKNNYQPIDFYTGTSGTSTLAMRIDDNGFVGIGITNPTATLHVNGGLRVATVNEATSYAGDKFLVSDSENFKYVDAEQLASLIDPYITSGGKFVDGTDTNDAVYTTGNVGIGTTSPDFKLVSLSTATDADEFTIVAAKSNSIGDFTGIGLSGYQQVVKAGIVLDRSGNYGVGDLHFLNNNTADTSDATLSDSKITIKADGNVGIGTQSPSAQLHVGSSLTLPSGFVDIKTIIHGGAFINLQEEDVKVFGIFCAPNGESILQIDTDPQRFLIDPSGNNETKVGIGTDSPSTLLEIASGGNTDAAVGSPTFRINNTTNDSSWAVGDVVGTLEYYSSDPGGNAPYITSFIKSVNENNGGTAPSGALTFGTTAYSAAGGAVERLRITDGGDVGIGTTSPDYRLDLQSTDSTSIRVKSTGTGATDNAFLRLEIGGTDASNAIAFGSASNAFQGQIRYVHSDNYMAFHGNGNLERMRIASNGNIGIGTTVPSQPLHVSGNARVTGAYYDSNNSPGTSGQILSSTATGTDWVDAASGGGVSSIIAGTNITISPTGGTGAVTINASSGSGGGKFVDGTDTNDAVYTTGNVGVGTTTPSEIFEVQGDGDGVISINDTDFPQLKFKEGGTQTAKIYTSGQSGGELRFDTGTTLRMRIDESGNVGIGTSNPGQALTVGDSTSTGNSILVEGSNSDNTYTVFEGKRKYPKLILNDTISGGSSFSLWNLGNTLRFGTNVGSAANAAWYTKSGDAADVIFNGDIGIGTNIPSQPLHVSGNARVTGAYYDSNNSPGTSGQVLSSTATGTDWIDTGGISYASYYISVIGAVSTNLFLNGTLSEHISPVDISFNSSNGRFTFAKAAKYKLNFGLIVSTASSQTLTVTVVKNSTTTLHTMNFRIHSAVDPVERSASMILEFAANDYIDVNSTINLTTGVGTSVTMVELVT